MKPARPQPRLVALALIWLAFAATAWCQPTGVGLTGEVRNVLLPGPELRVKPDPEGRSPVVVRLVAAYPHGTAGYRYDFTWFAYETGPHNLAAYLERTDGSSAGELPPIPVEAAGILPPGPPGPLSEFNAPLPRLGGYRTLLITAGCLWGAGLIALLCWRKSAVQPMDSAPTPEPALADRLRGLLDRARAGTLDADSRAQLDRLVLGFWRERLGLGTLPIPDAVRQLRDHPEAGNLLRHVETWLHSGRSPASESEVAALLAPYLEKPPPSQVPPNTPPPHTSPSAAPATHS